MKQKDKQNTYKPRIIFWELTKKCNLKCLYCKVWGNKSGLRELKTQEALSLVSEIKKYFSDSLLILSGGEPLLRKDLCRILSFISSKGLKAAMATNGTLLNERQVIFFKGTCLERISISLDSVKEGNHDALRGIKGSFRKALDSCAILKKHAIPFQINFNLTRKNVEEVPSAANLALSLGAKAIHYFILINAGCAARKNKNHIPQAPAIRKTLLKIERLSREFPIELKPTCAPQYACLVDKGARYGCLAAKKAFFISSEGNVYPCGYLPVKAGSAIKTPLIEIWRNSSVFKKLRRGEFKGDCFLCSYKNICGGCRARAYSITGDYMASDPLCPIIP